MMGNQTGDWDPVGPDRDRVPVGPDWDWVLQNE